MKTITLKVTLAAIALLTIQQVKAQKVYIDVNAGYALPIGGQIGLESSTSTHYYNEQTGESSGSTTYKSVNSNFGKGLNFGGSIGYMFNKNIGFEIGLNYLMGASIKTESVSTRTHVDYWGVTTVYEYQYMDEASSNMFQFTPTIVLSPGFDKFNPYTKIGFVMGMGKVTTESTSTSSNYSNSSYADEFTGGMGFGVSGSIGAQYALTEKIALFSEIKFISFSYAPQKSTTTKYTVDGIDQLPSMTTRDKETEYVKEYTVDYNDNNNPDADSPRKSTKMYLPYNNVGLNLGVTFSF